MEGETECSELPDCLIEEILVRLPVKSILKFKCVSKLWYSSMSTKNFIKTHTHISKNNNKFSHHNILKLTKKPNAPTFWGLDRYSFPNFSLSHDNFFPSLYDLTVGKINAGFDLVGSCNGLICVLLGKTRFLLRNPATRKGKWLPYFHPSMDNSLLYISKYGFCFDESSDDYKVFVVLSVRGFCKAVGKVYSLKADSWRTIEIANDQVPVPVEAAGKYASGKLHWAKNEGGFEWDIFSFDLQREVFENCSPPSYVAEGGVNPTLRVFDECLYLVCEVFYLEMEIWIWNEYGVEASWTKLVRMPHYSYPLCVLPNRDLLFGHGTCFISYSPNKSYITYPKMINDSDEYVEAEVFVETLVSLD